MEKINRLFKKYIQNQAVQIISVGIILNMLVECLNRRSLGGLLLPFSHPVMFFYNTFIICGTLSVVLLVRRKIFVYTLVGVLWIGIGMTDYIVQSARKTPFTAMDLYLIKDGLKVIPVYLNAVQMVLIIVGIVAVIAGLVIWWFKAPTYRYDIFYIRNTAKIGIVAAVLILVTNAFVTWGTLAVHFGNLPNAYKQYGLAYCFSASIVNRGISKPNEYSAEYIQKLKDNISIEGNGNNDNPNIIFLQMESFMDPNLIEGVSFSENPVPYFQELASKYSSGYLSVPCVGAGTANTEFEVQTGMNIDDFGPGEYPYRTIMQSTTCESVAYDLKKLGYSTHAVHDNDATFYDRNRVFANLGYDTFTSIEYMNSPELTSTGWAKDKILTPEISQIMDSTTGKDYLFTISVQGHGDYPSVLPTDMKYNIKSKGFFDKSSEVQFEYYINQLKEMDDFLRELTTELEKREEKTILVIYGDHLPGFTFTEDNLKTKDLYQTQYVIWNNYNIQKKNCNLQAFQLSSYLLGRIGITEGIVNKFHQTQMTSDDYLKNLKVLEYDVLYGDYDAFGGVNPYEPTVLKMGTRDINISNVYNFKDYVCIEGENFNDFSAVYINGKECESIIINDHLLIVDKYTLKLLDVVYVEQKGEDKIELSRTKAFTYRK